MASRTAYRIPLPKSGGYASSAVPKQKVKKKKKPIKRAKKAPVKRVKKELHQLENRQKKQ